MQPCSIFLQEVASRTIPYQDVKVTSAVLDRILNGVLPARPDSSTLSDDMWALCLKCWIVYAPHRPSMQAVLSVLDNMPRPGRPAESPIVEAKAGVTLVTS